MILIIEQNWHWQLHQQATLYCETLHCETLHYTVRHYTTTVVFLN